MSKLRKILIIDDSFQSINIMVDILDDMNLEFTMFSAVSGMSMKEIKPTASYTIDTAGINPRVYEFKTSTGRECVLVVLTGDQPSSTLQCETPTVKAN